MTRRLTITKDMVGELTVGELELLEERTKRAMSKLFDPDEPRGPLLHALAYIVLRREDPEVTWEAAADVVVKLAEAEAEAPADPSEGPGRPDA
jgi:hypothetical protein